MSYHSRNTDSLNATLKTLMKRGAHVGLGIGAFTPILALANPTGGHVAAGSATIGTNGNTTTIKQSSSAAIINWQQFNIGAGQYVQFLQPSSSSVILNRVVGGGLSSIYGNLTANGQVFLVNPNGVFFGKGSVLDAQGFVASTLNISDTNFMAGHYNFQKGTGAPGASIINQGSISAHNGGYVVLAGDYAENDGLIAAPSGHVILASGARATLALSGNHFVNFAVNQATLAGLAGVDNAGQILADGGTVVMTADVANQLRATVVNNTGLIEARGISKAANGIYLTAKGGNIENAGTLDASGLSNFTQGGTIRLISDAVTHLDATSNINVSGHAAKGGFVEVSGPKVGIHGQMNIGRGGMLFLDPNILTINTGTGHSHSTGFGTGTGTVGVPFIQGVLNAGGSVDLEAATKISASANVHSITATGPGAGTLILTIGNHGTIDVSGVTINIKGDFDTSIHTFGSFVSASLGFRSATEKFGQISAKDVNLGAGSGVITVGKATTVAGVVHPSIKTTGDIVVNSASKLQVGSGSINLSAGGNLIIHGIQPNFSNSFTQQAGSIQNAGGGVTLKGTDVDVANVQGTDITVKGQLANSTGGTLGHGLDFVASSHGTIKLNHGVTANGAVSFFGSHLAYSGAGAFDVAAQGGRLYDDAAIGAAGAGKAVNFAVNFTGSGSGGSFGNVFVTQNIYTTKSITVTGRNVIIGSNEFGPLVLSADDGKSSTTGDVVKLTATAPAGEVAVRGEDAFATNGAVDKSVTVHAGQDVDMSGFFVLLGEGSANAIASGAHATATAKANVTISAGHDINLDMLSGTFVEVRGGSAHATVKSDTVATATATAQAITTLTAGHDINARAVFDVFEGGSALAQATAHSASQAVTATADTSVKLSATHNVAVRGVFVDVLGGSIHSASNTFSSGTSFKRTEDFAKASFSGAKAVGTAHADVSVSGGNAVQLTGTVVSVKGGSNVGGAGTFGGSHSGFTHFSFHTAAGAFAKAKNASATLTATANAAITAGAGGITLNDISGGVSLAGGSNVALAIADIASNSGAKAAVDAEAKVNLTTTGAIKLIGHNVKVRGGNDAAGTEVSFVQFGCCSGSSFNVGANVAAAKNDTVALTADAGVSLKGTAVTLSASHDASIFAGSRAGKAAPSYGGYGFSAGITGLTETANINAGVAITASGTFTMTAGRNLEIFGGSSAGRSVHFNTKGTAGTATITDQDGVKVTAGGNISLQAQSFMTLHGKSSAARFTGVHASSGAAAAMTVFNGVSLTTGKNFSAFVSGGSLSIYGGGFAASQASVTATKKTASLSVDSGVHITAPGTMTLHAGQNINIGSSSFSLGDAARFAQVHATSGQAALTALGNVTLTAGGAFIAQAGASISIHGSFGPAGGSTFGSASVTAKKTGATATLTADNGVSITAGGAVTLAARDSVKIEASDSAANQAQVHASSGGIAKLTAKSAVSITAGGAFTATAVTGSITISAGERGGVSASVTAGSGTATLTADDGVHITAKGAMTLKAGDGVFISGSDEPGSQANVHATAKGTATETALSNVTITAGGAFTATAGSGSLYILGSDDAGESASVTAKGSHANASLTADSGVHLIAGGSVTLKAFDELHILGGDAAGYSATVSASNGGVAAEIAKGSVTITTGGNFTASAGHSSLEIYGGSEAGESATVKAKGTGVTATLTADSGVHITAPGNISLTAGGSNLSVEGEDDAGYSASVTANSGGVATETAFGNVTLAAGGSLKATAHSTVFMSASSKAGYNASVTATGTGAKASLTADTGVTVTAVGNITLKGHFGVSLSGSNSAAEIANVNGNSGGVASLKANAALTITGGANLLVDGGVSYVYFSPGTKAGDGASVIANHGTATLTADGGVHVTVPGSVTVHAGSFIDIFGAGSAGKGATVKATSGTATETALNSVTITAGGAFAANAGSSISLSGGNSAGRSASVKATGTGAKATLTADTGAHIKVGTTLTLKAGTSFAAFSGGHNAGRSATVNGASGAATLTALSDITLTAGGAFTASAASSDMNISGGYGAGRNVSITTTKGTATLTADSGVHITAGGNILLRAGTSLGIFAGQDSSGNNAAGAFDSITATSGTAKLTALSNVSLTAGGAFTASAAGSSLSFVGGRRAAAHTTVSVVKGKASLTVDAGVAIFAKGPVTMHAATFMGFFGGSRNGSFAHAIASGSAGATATVTANNSINISGTGLTFNAGTNMSFGGGRHNMSHGLASVQSGAGGVATLNGTAQVNLTATGAIAAHAGSYLEFFAGRSNALSAKAKANSGTATVTANGGVNIAAPGTFAVSATGMSLEANGNNAKSAIASASNHGVATVKAVDSVNVTVGGAITMRSRTGNLSIYGDFSNASLANVTAKTLGTATITADGSVNIKAASMALSAATSFSIEGGGRNAARATLHATGGGAATLNALADVNINLTGAFTANAGSSLSIYASHQAARALFASASGAGAKTKVTADNSVNLNAKSVSLTAGSSLFVYGGSNAAGTFFTGTTTLHDTVVATKAGNASVTVKSAVNINVVTGFSALLTGFSSSNDLSIYGGSRGAKQAHVTAASSHAVATLAVTNNVNIKVTGAGGTIKLSTGTQTENSLSIFAGNSAGRSANVVGAKTGTATLTDDNSVNLKAPGAITMSAVHGGLSIYGGFRHGSGTSNGSAVTAVGSQSAAKATVGLKSQVNITGASLTLSASKNVAIIGGARSVGRSDVAVGVGATASVSVDDTVNIKLTGAFSAKAGGSLSIYGGSHDNARSASVVGVLTGGVASLVTDTSVNLTAGGAVSLTATHNLSIYGNSSFAGRSANVVGSNHGTATLKAQGNVNITGGGAFTAKAGDDLSIHGGSEAGRHVTVVAGNVGAGAHLTALANVTIKAAGAVTLAAGTGFTDSLHVQGSRSAGRSASVVAGSTDTATLDAEGKVKITSGSNLTATAGGNISVSGGEFAGANQHIGATKGTATVVTDSSVLMTAVGNLTLTLAGGSLNINAGDSGGLNAVIAAHSAGGAVNVTDNAQINLLATGALKVSGAFTIARNAGDFPSPAALTSTGGATAKAKIDQSITLSGTAVTLNVTGTKHSGSGSGTAGGRKQLGKVKNVIHAPGVTPVPLAAMTLSVQPATSGTSFGASQDLGTMSTTDLSQPASGSSVTSAAGVTLTGSPLITLGNLGEQGFIMNLETVVAPALLGQPPSWYRIETQSSTDYTPVTGAASYLDSLSSPCTVIVLGEEGAKACVAAN